MPAFLLEHISQRRGDCAVLLRWMPCCSITRAEDFLIATAPSIAEKVANAIEPGSQQAARLVSLDAFRGITIAAMLLVNDPGSWGHIYAPLEHAAWNGWTPTDLIFPFFLFIAGVSIALSFDSRLKRGVGRGSLALHIVRRSVMIFALGLFLNGFPQFDFHTIRITGVLQRIGICYFVAGLLYAAIRNPVNPGEHTKHVRMRTAVLAAAMIALLIGYWALMTFVSVPGYGTGHLGKNDSLAAYIDRTILGKHLWQESKTWDPEGLLSTLPAIATTLLGSLAGSWLGSALQPKRKIARLVAVGIGCALAGQLLQPYFPINKNLWTSTFALFTGGLAMLLFSLFYWVVDVRKWRWWTPPFLVLGRNAILAYAVASLISEASIDFEFLGAQHSQTIHDWLYQKFFIPYATPVNASLAYAVAFVLLILILLWPLHRRKIFVRI